VGAEELERYAAAHPPTDRVFFDHARGKPGCRYCGQAFPAERPCFVCSVNIAALRKWAAQKYLAPTMSLREVFAAYAAVGP
jgi:hypothetical protein